MHKLHLLLQRLAEAKVEFVVIGGYAAKEAVGREKDKLTADELRCIAGAKKKPGG